jgi:tetratricopeptide (TPR) repeat protein
LLLIRLEPDWSEGYIIVGLAFKHQKNYKEAIDYLDQAIEKETNPNIKAQFQKMRTHAANALGFDRP